MSKRIEELERELIETKETIDDIEIAGLEDNQSQKDYRKFQKKKMLLKARLDERKKAEEKFKKEISNEVTKEMVKNGFDESGAYEQGYEKVRQEFLKEIDDFIIEHKVIKENEG